MKALIARANREESGRITLLAIGILAVVLLLGYSVIAASSVHLERKGLQTLAESLAVRAASAVSVQGYLARGPGGPYLSEQAAREAIDEHLARMGTALPDSFAVLDVSVGEERVSVSTRSVATPPFLPDYLWPVELRSQASAELYEGRIP